MSYRSKDIEYMNELKNKVNELNYNAYSENTFQESWEQVRKFIVLDDLNKFLREKYLTKELKYVPEYVYNGNILNPDIMFITASENPMELEVFDSLVTKAGITNYYRTSYLKHSDVQFYDYGSSKLLNTVIESEIKIIAPKIVIFFGMNLAKYFKVTDKHIEIQVNGFPPLLATCSMLDLFSNQLNEGQRNTLKHYMWNDVTKYIRK